jgi:hypothetical protein
MSKKASADAEVVAVFKEVKKILWRNIILFWHRAAGNKKKLHNLSCFGPYFIYLPREFKTIQRFI